MIRWIWRGATAPTRTLTEDEFLSELLQLAERSFAGVPQGPVTIESLDVQERVCWRAYYQRPQELLGLARHLCDERALRERAARTAVPRP